jgi:hypothetical protein
MNLAELESHLEALHVRVMGLEGVTDPIAAESIERRLADLMGFVSYLSESATR